MSFYDQESQAAALLSLVERHAPRLMRCGGGGLPQEMSEMSRPLTEADRRRIVKLAETAPSIPAISRAVRWSDATVRNCLHEAGVPTPFLRITGIQKGAPRKRTGPRTSKILSLNSKHHE